MVGMDTEIDRTIIELLKCKDFDYVGVDVRIRKEDSTTFSVFYEDDELPENTDDDDITRLKDKLELLKKIDEMLEKLKKYDTDYTPYIYPYQPSPTLWDPFGPPHYPHYPAWEPDTIIYSHELR